MLIVGMVSQVNAQQRNVKGKVTDASTGKSLPGVNVFVKGTTVGTATNANGAYSLSVPQSADSLVFSYIGYDAKSVAISGQTTINVQLSPSVEQLENVVVTAFGIKRKERSLGYSSQNVNTKSMESNRSANFVNNLQGKIAGVHITSSQGTPGSSTRIVLRGVSSLAGNNQPLFVVDGVPIDNSTFRSYNAYGGGPDYGNAAMDIDPDNIASINVLKGPNAAALYGSRAANGAIVITTKSGGPKNGKAVGISINSTTTFQQVAVLPNLQNLYGQGSDGQFQFVDGKGGGTNDGIDESWGPRLNGQKITQWWSNGKAVPWVAHPNNVKDYFNTGHTISNNFAISGGSKDNATYRLSFTNLSQAGTIPNSSLNRSNVALNTTAHLTDKLTATGNVSYIRLIGRNRPNVGYSSLNPMQQLTQWIGRQVDISKLRDFQNPDGTERNWNYNYHNNVFWETYKDFDKQTRDRIIGRIQLTYDFNNWLNLRGYTGTDTYRENRSRGIAVNDIAYSGLGHYFTGDYYVSQTTSDLILSADKDLTKDFHVSAQLGGESIYTIHNQTGATAPTLSVPGVYNLTNSGQPLVPDNYYSRKKVNSIYGSATIGYKDYLYLDLTGRNDWSSTLPQANNSYFYPSVSVSDVFTDMLGIKSDFLTFGKIRASWTRVGNDTNPYQLQATYASQGLFGSLPFYRLSTTIPNLNLKPEKTTSWELGTNLRFFKNRMGLDLTYYSRKTEDQILGVQIPGSSGFTHQFINAGEVDNKGIEVTFNATPVQSRDFTWDFTVNWAKNKNEVISLTKGVDSYQMASSWGVYLLSKPGEPIGTLWGRGWKYNSKGQRIMSGGIPERTSDLKNFGSYQPNWTGSFSNTFSYKNLSLSTLIDVQQGGHLYSVTNMFGHYTGILKSTLVGREKSASDTHVYPGVNEDGSPNTTAVTAEHFFHSSYYGLAGPNVYDASYVKLRQLELTYSLPKKLVNNSPFSRVELSLVGRNLWIIHKNVPNIDPESAFGNGNIQGFESNQIPSVRSFGFNVRLSL